MEEIILIVDDNVENLKVVANLLKDQNYKIALAKNGEEALNVLENLRPVLILLDVMMPQLDGFELSSIIKSKSELADVPIIFLTAKAESIDIVKGFEAGGVDYVTKPFNSAELIVRIDNHIQIKRAKEIIAKQAEELRKLNAMKDLVFSIISHDLYTPFASLKLLLDSLKQADLCSQKEFVAHSIELMDMTTNETMQLFENLLYWSRQQMGSVRYSPVFFNPLDVIKNVISLYQYNAIRKKIKIQVNSPGKISVFADLDMANLILRNIVSNAIKFSFPGQLITIEIQTIKEYTQISVTNKGPGMSEDIIAKVLSANEFYSVSGTSGEKGTGLGLKIVSNFISINSGKISVVSKDDSTTFFISLPNK